MTTISNSLFYFTDKNQNISMMNRLSFLEYLTINDYYSVTINDSIKFRLDKITEYYLQNPDYYIFIMWLNGIKNISELDVGYADWYADVSYKNGDYINYLGIIYQSKKDNNIGNNPIDRLNLEWIIIKDNNFRILYIPTISYIHNYYKRIKEERGV